MTWRGYLVLAGFVALIGFGAWVILTAKDNCAASGGQWEMVSPVGRMRDSIWRCEP